MQHENHKEPGAAPHPARGTRGPGRGSAWWRLGVTAVVACACVASTARAQTNERELKMKAAYLYNFGMYLGWPAGRPVMADDAFVIGVLGPDTVGQYLRQIAQVRGVGNRKLVVKHFATLEELEFCHILFMADHVEPALQSRAISQFRGSGVLMVGESADFISRGGSIRFFVADNRLHLTISKSACEREGHTISAKMLQLSVVELVR